MSELRGASQSSRKVFGGGEQSLRPCSAADSSFARKSVVLWGQSWASGTERRGKGEVFAVAGRRVPLLHRLLPSTHSGIREPQTLYDVRPIRSPTINLALCSRSFVPPPSPFSRANIAPWNRRSARWTAGLALLSLRAGTAAMTDAPPEFAEDIRNCAGDSGRREAGGKEGCKTKRHRLSLRSGFSKARLKSKDSKAATDNQAVPRLYVPHFPLIPRLQVRCV